MGAAHTNRRRIRMIAVDLDGTLLNSRKKISDEDRAALGAAAARGVEIVPVTGRNYSTALPIVAELLTTGPLIASNGAIIRSKEGETYRRGLLPVDVAHEVLRATPEYRYYTVITYDRSGEGQFRIQAPGEGGRGSRGEDGKGEEFRSPDFEFRSARTNTRDEQRNVTASRVLSPMPPTDGVAFSPWIAKYQHAVRFCDSLESELDGDPVEIMFAGPVELMRAVEERLARLTAEDAEEAKRQRTKSPHVQARVGHPQTAGSREWRVGSREAEETNDGRGGIKFRLLRTEYPERNFSILDVIREDCSKGTALEFWSRHRGLGREEVMAIGDNYNDLEMLRYAGVPVVMGNSEEAVKREGRQQGWAVTLDCDSGGVARAVEKYVLGE